MGEEKNRVLSNSASRWSAGPSFFFLLLVIVVLLSAPDARGISAALFESPRERSLGSDYADACLWRASPPGVTGTRCRFEAGEWLLHGIDGLRVHAAAVELENPAWELRVSAAFLEAPVGRENSFEAGVCVPFAGRIRLGTALRWDTAGLDGCESAHLVSLSVSAVLRVTGRVALVTRAANIRVAGEPLAGAGASIGLVLSAESAVSAVARLELSPAGAASFRLASRARLGRRVVFCLGYEEDTGSLDGSVWIGIRGIGLDAGSSFHPVLGVSQGLFLSWGRGW